MAMNTLMSSSNVLSSTTLFRVCFLGLAAVLLLPACRPEESDETQESEGPNTYVPVDSGMGGSAPAELGVTDPDSPVVINEFMPSNSATIADEAGGTGDWIEIYNRSDTTVDLTGFFVSDNAENPTKHALPSGLEVAPGEAMILWADSDEEDGPNHLPFNLKKAGEEILISDPGGALLDSIAYQNATTDSSFARVPDGSGDFTFCVNPTPGEPNGDGC